MKTIFGAPFEFGWNPAKAASNLEKHNVSFKMVEQFEFGTCVTTEDNRQDYDEDRYIALGFIGERLHVLVFTLRHITREVWRPMGHLSPQGQQTGDRSICP